MSRFKIGLQTHIWNNNLKSIGLLAFYPFLILGMIWAVITLISFFSIPNWSLQHADAQAWRFIQAYWMPIFTFIGGWFILAYLFHTQMIRRISHSHPITRKEEPELYNLFENLCISVGIVAPRLEVIESHARNAFASGIDQKSFSVTVTRGLIQSLTKEELEGVLAHELTHILNRDARLLIISIVFTGMLGFAAQMIWSQVHFGRWVGGQNSKDKKGNGIIILALVWIVLWVGYCLTLLSRFAISRHREYMADAGAVQITRNPEAMMRALMKIAGKDKIPIMPDDIAMICIENDAPFMGVFSTHPLIEKRIKAISETTGVAIPEYHAPLDIKC